MLKLDQQQESPVQQKTISLDVETYVETEVGHRRFRWLLTESGEALPSTQSFATKREAIISGETALARALQRGRLRP